MDLSTERLRARLLDALTRAGVVRDPRIAAALGEVPRHLFVPGVDPVTAYADRAIVTRWGAGGPQSSCSQPAIVAIMLDQLELRPGLSVLEIGAGTGYNAALLAHVVGPTGRVVTLDVDAGLVAAAGEHLRAAGADGVQVVCADGAAGYPPGAPYDRIVSTAGVWDVPTAWVDQLAPDGRLVVPLDVGGPQVSLGLRRAGEVLRCDSVVDCGFVRLQGAAAGPEARVPLGGGITAELRRPWPDTPDASVAGAWARALHRPGSDVPTGVWVPPGRVWPGLATWLGLTVPTAGLVAAPGPGPGGGLPGAAGPAPGGSARSAATAAVAGLLPAYAAPIFALRKPVVFDAAGFAGLATEAPPESADLPALGAHPLLVRPFGTAAGAVDRLRAAVRAWDAAGQPTTAGMRVRLVPRVGAGSATGAAHGRDGGGTACPGEDAAGVTRLGEDRRWHRVVVDWPSGPG